MGDDSPPTGVIGPREPGPIHLSEYDPAWPARYAAHAERIRRALGPAALRVEHIGSTSVPGLAAKPIIDIVVAVSDAADEDAYLPALLAAGYELRVREPDWLQHRMLRTPEKDVHVHVYSAGCREIARNLAFRDRLRASPADLARYEQVKRELAARHWESGSAYSDAKSEVVESILAAAANPGTR